MTIQYGDKLVHRAELWASSRGRWTLEIAYSDEVIPVGTCDGNMGLRDVCRDNRSKSCWILQWRNRRQNRQRWAGPRSFPPRGTRATIQACKGGSSRQSSGSRRRNVLRRNGHGQTSNELVSTIARFLLAPKTNRGRRARRCYRARRLPWTDFDGATRVGARPAPSTPPALRCSNTTRLQNGRTSTPTIRQTFSARPSRPIRSAKRPLIINELYAWARMKDSIPRGRVYGAIVRAFASRRRIARPCPRVRPRTANARAPTRPRNGARQRRARVRPASQS